MIADGDVGGYRGCLPQIFFRQDDYARPLAFSQPHFQLPRIMALADVRMQRQDDGEFVQGQLLGDARGETWAGSVRREVAPRGREQDQGLLSGHA